LTQLRIVADDLTGALDTAVGFAGALGPVLVCRQGAPVPPGADAAIDIGTRDLDATEWAAASGTSVAPFGDAILCFKKIDSLLRGHWAAEVAALAASDRFDRIAIAPAFVQQGRLTIDGCLHLRDSQGTVQRSSAPPIAASLKRAGLLGPTIRHAGEMLSAPEDVVVFDVSTVEEMSSLATAGLRWPGRTLWVGAAGLARALARSPVSVQRTFEPPLLFVIGSVHPSACAQVQRLRQRLNVPIVAHRPTVPPSDTADRLLHWLHQPAGTAVLTFEMPPDTPPKVAEAAIQQSLHAVAPLMVPPFSLFVTGGQTLSSLCAAVGASSLLTRAEWSPGTVCSTLEDGLWSGCQVISRSGAFGDEDALIDLALLANHSGT